MEKQQTLTEAFKNNKLLAFGVPLILIILLLDTFVLRPSRRAKELERQGIKRNVAPSATVQKSSFDSKDKKAPIATPAPVGRILYPSLSTELIARFGSKMVYPFPEGRNPFKEVEKPLEIVEVVEEVVVKPDISYHGFFTVGKDRVAILRNSDEILLTKIGGNLRRTSFKLASISSEKVVLTDLSDKIRDFEISLADGHESK